MKWFCYIFFFFINVQEIISQEKASFKPIFEDLPIDDPAENSILQPGENPSDKIKKNIFAKAAVSKRQCFLGEPVLLTYQLYSSLQSNSRVQKKPVLFGCTITDLETNNEMPVYKKVNGKNYRVFDVARLQLVPVKTGLLRIDPIVVENKVNYKVDDKSRNYAGNILSEAVEFTVNPLPSKNKPDNFSGLVGIFRISNNVSRATNPAMEPDTLRIIITGSGNFSDVSIPEILWPSEFETYPLVETLELSPNSFPTTGTKVIAIPFLPKKEGKYTIPASEITTFNPATAAYEKQSLPELALTITAPLPKAEIVTEKIVEEKETIPTYLWILLGIALLIIAALVGYIRQKSIKHRPVFQDNPEVVQQPAPKVDYLNEILSLQTVKDPGDFITHFKTLLIQYIRDRLKDESSSEEKLLGKMHFSGSQEFANVHSIYEQCNFLLYAPASLDDSTRKKLVQDFAAVVREYPVE